MKSPSRARISFDLSWRTKVSLAIGALLGTLAFSHAAASTGIAIEPFRPLGGNFFAMSAGQGELIQTISPQGSTTRPAKTIEFGRTVLQHSPLSARAAWLLAVGYGALSDRDKARTAMLRAERISRREPGVQIWLARDALERNDATQALNHFDTLLRTSNSRTASTILPRLAAVLTAPEGRAALLPYAREDNPWFGDLMAAAANSLPQAQQMASYLVANGKVAPDGDTQRAAYGTMMQRLATERAYGLMMQVYPLLPGSNPDEPRSLSVQRTSGAEHYPPVAWDLLDSTERGGTPIALGQKRLGIEFFGAPSTVGVAGRKILTPGAARRIRFMIAERTTNPDSSAHWIATCVGNGGDGPSTRSVDLSEAPQSQVLSLDLPSACPIIRLEMSIAGGIGRDPTRIVVEGLELVDAS